LNDALHNYYKEILGNINYGNEHDGIPLVKEIYEPMLQELETFGSLAAQVTLVTWFCLK
jgi:hypothetical protein